MMSRMYSAVNVSVRRRRLMFDRISACRLIFASNAETSEAYSVPVNF